MDQLSKAFSALADPTRRDLVARLTGGDATVGELAAPYDVSLQAVSKHLKVLEQAGLVSRSRDAQRRPVHLEADVLDLMTGWIERYRRRAEERYQRLDAVLEELAERHRIPKNEERHEQPAGSRGGHLGEATIHADPTVPTIRITRDFRATPAQLFRAHTDPDLFARWVGPASLQTNIEEWSCPPRRQLALLGRPRRRTLRVPRLLPHRARRPHRADVHLRGQPGRRRPRDLDVRGPG